MEVEGARRTALARESAVVRVHLEEVVIVEHTRQDPETTDDLVILRDVQVEEAVVDRLREALEVLMNRLVGVGDLRDFREPGLAERDLASNPPADAQKEMRRGLCR